MLLKSILSIFRDKKTKRKWSKETDVGFLGASSWAATSELWGLG